jgi:hypothetical protein
LESDHQRLGGCPDESGIQSRRQRFPAQRQFETVYSRGVVRCGGDIRCNGNMACDETLTLRSARRFSDRDQHAEDSFELLDTSILGAVRRRG